MKVAIKDERFYEKKDTWEYVEMKRANRNWKSMLKKTQEKYMARQKFKFENSNQEYLLIVCMKYKCLYQLFIPNLPITSIDTFIFCFSKVFPVAIWLMLYTINV